MCGLSTWVDGGRGWWTHDSGLPRQIFLVACHIQNLTALDLNPQGQRKVTVEFVVVTCAV